MKAFEFCYWLQGLFEINNPRDLGVNQVDLIQKHLEMVYVHEKEQSKYLDFCKHLTGYFKISGRGDVERFVMNNIKRELDKLFEHVIVKKEEKVNFSSYQKPGMQLQVNDKDDLVRC